MRVFLTGATGVLGHRLVRRLVDRGHEVIGLARDDVGADRIEGRGGIPRRGDVLDRAILAVDDVDAVIHAATSIPTATRPPKSAWARNDRIRLQGAKNLVAAVGDDIEQFLFPSVVWVARQPDGSPFDESATRYPDRGTRGAAEVEDYLPSAAEEHGFKATILRCGLFYAPDADSTRRFGRSLLGGLTPVVGGGLLGRTDAPLSRLHADDAARAFVAALEDASGGCYHVIDDEPVGIGPFLDELARHLDTGGPGPRLPRWLVRPLVGRVTADLLSRSMPTANDQFREVTGWEPRYPSYRDGLAQVVETWEADTTIRATETGYDWVGEA